MDIIQNYREPNHTLLIRRRLNLIKKFSFDFNGNLKTLLTDN